MIRRSSCFASASALVGTWSTGLVWVRRAVPQLGLPFFELDYGVFCKEFIWVNVYNIVRSAGSEAARL